MSRSGAAIRSIAVAGCLAAATPILAASQGVLLRLAPYGDLFRLVPGGTVGALAPLPRLAHSPDGHAFEERKIPPLRLTPSILAVSLPGKVREQEDDDDDDEDPRPSKPGTLPTNFVKLPDPTPYLKQRTLGPHLKPDAEFSVDDRTTVGVLTQFDRARVGTPGNTSLVTPVLPKILPAAAASHVTQALRGRDLGIGASFEIKLGK